MKGLTSGPAFVKMPSVLQDKPLQAVMNFMNQFKTGSVGITHVYVLVNTVQISTCEICVITVTILQNPLKLMHSAGVQIESLFTEKQVMNEESQKCFK